jgi:hypothetical protein
MVDDWIAGCNGLVSSLQHKRYERVDCRHPSDPQIRQRHVSPSPICVFNAAVQPAFLMLVTPAPPLGSVATVVQLVLYY